MARNGSGTYSKVNTFVAGNTITAAGHNENWDDLVTEMSNSVAADGQTSITGQLKGANGTKTAPSYSFATDLDTGMYRIGANNLGLSCGDTKILDITTAGAAITGTLSASGAVTASSTLAVTGNVAVNTDKFNVTAASGNTTVAGTLGVTGAVTNSSTTEMTGNVTVNTNKLTVAAATGNTVIAGTLNVTGVATLSGGVAGLIAAQSDQETGTSTTLAVSPGRQQFHPSAAKCWIECDAAGNRLTAGDYNVTSISDDGVGLLTVTIATDFSSIVYAVIPGVTHNTNLATKVLSATQAAGSVQISVVTASTNAAADPTNHHLVMFGDQ